MFVCFRKTFNSQPFSCFPYKVFKNFENKKSENVQIWDNHGTNFKIRDTYARVFQIKTRDKLLIFGTSSRKPGRMVTVFSYHVHFKQKQANLFFDKSINNNIIVEKLVWKILLNGAYFYAFVQKKKFRWQSNTKLRWYTEGKNNLKSTLI